MRITTIAFFFLLSSSITCFSQTSDFFAGKWEITVFNSPKGDVTFLTELIRKDGKLTGELVEKADPANSSRKILRVEESHEKLVVYFESSQGGETILDLAKVDQDNLKGTVHDFEATAKRLK
ncbi:hypothetical protein [Dyadobacter jiangsuensis]|uniref:Lipocalin-like protein n=1 Tax=Dyadobacter jiangsuensis TaxID=1591085 RepID=A0A2P8FDV1_9BACT|nr:hypothetical protein [Dyadobacter jiangsuensis]PSL19887.1 hypothetical protein CLV60_12559 [Dyadobacter jiangsuensis]